MPKNLEKRWNTFHAVLFIPVKVRHHFGGKVKFTQSLQTDSESEALRRAAPLLARWRSEINAAKNGTRDALEADVQFWREALTASSSPREKGVIEHSILEEAEKLESMQSGLGVSYYKRSVGEVVGVLDHLDEYLSTLDNASKTVDMKRSDIKRFAKAFPTLDRVSKRDVQRWVNSLIQDDGLRGKTVNRVLSALRNYWSYLQRLQEVSEDLDPFSRVQVSRLKVQAKDRRRAFLPQDVVRILSAAESKGDRQLADVILLGMWTGGRIEALSSLRISDIDQIKWSITFEGDKTEAGDRTIPVHTKLRPHIERMIAGRAEGYLVQGLSFNKYDDRSNAVGKRFGYLKNSLGYDRRYVFHSIRKTVITIMENAGVPENVAADIVGHDKQTMTFGLYSDGNYLEIMRGALEKVDYPAI